MLRDPRFRTFWLAQVVSDAGTGVGMVAFPLTAVLALDASAMEMGVLAAASQVPVLLLALHAGVWVDRLPRQPIMVATNLGRGALLALVPLAAVSGFLSMEVLWTIAFATGILAVVFDLAMTSYPPTIVRRDQLVEANASLQTGGRGAQIAGPAAAGWLVNVIGAPLTVLIDAISFVMAGLLIATIRAEESSARPPRRSTLSEIGEGIAAVWRDPVIRAMVFATTLGSFGGAIQQAVLVLFAVDYIGMSAPTLGLTYAIGSATGLAGAALTGAVARWLGPGGALLVSGAIIVASFWLILPAPPGPVGELVVGASWAIFLFGMAMYSVTQIALRQAITPPHLLGRVNATRRVTVFGIIPFGALLGGYLGSTLGLHAALFAAAIAQLASLVAIVASPLRTARESATSSH